MCLRGGARHLCLSVTTLVRLSPHGKVYFLQATLYSCGRKFKDDQCGFATDVCNVELEDKKIIFFIEYPGSGFDWNKLLEQTDIDKNKETTSHAPTHGWGLFLLKKCCSAIKYYGIGNKLSFWFNFDNKI